MANHKYLLNVVSSCTRPKDDERIWCYKLVTPPVINYALFRQSSKSHLRVPGNAKSTWNAKRLRK